MRDTSIRAGRTAAHKTTSMDYTADHARTSVLNGSNTSNKFRLIRKTFGNETLLHDKQPCATAQHGERRWGTFRILVALSLLAFHTRRCIDDPTTQLSLSSFSDTGSIPLDLFGLSIQAIWIYSTPYLAQTPVMDTIVGSSELYWMKWSPFL